MPRVLLAVLLVFSLGLKLGLSSVPGEDDTAAAMAGQIAGFLGGQGFRPGEVIDNPGLPLVPAARDGCSLLVAEVSPEGWHRETLRRMAGPDDRTFFVFGGAVYEEQPIWRSWVRHQWHRLNGLVGRRLAVRPVLGVVARPGCALRAVAWRGLTGPP